MTKKQPAVTPANPNQAAEYKALFTLFVECGAIVLKDKFGFSMVQRIQWGTETMQRMNAALTAGKKDV